MDDAAEFAARRLVADMVRVLRSLRRSRQAALSAAFA
jgi:hypothetical protein